MTKPISCLRCLLLGSVVILGFSGAVISTGSGIFLYQLQEFSLLTPPKVNGPAVSLIGLGMLTCVLSWCAWQFDYSNKAQIITFAVFLGLIAVTETGVGIWALVRSERLDHLPEAAVLKASMSIDDPKSEDLWNHMQVRMDCCGVHGLHDDFVKQQKKVPPTCCYNSAKPCNGRGCLQPVLDRTRAILLYVFLLALCSVLLLAFIVGLSVCYAKAIAEGIERRRDEILRAAQEQAAAAAAFNSRPSTATSVHSANLSPLVEKPRRLHMP